MLAITLFMATSLDPQQHLTRIAAFPPMLPHFAAFTRMLPQFAAFWHILPHFENIQGMFVLLVCYILPHVDMMLPHFEIWCRILSWICRISKSKTYVFPFKMPHFGKTLQRGQSDLHPPAPNQTLPAYILPLATPCLHPPRDQIDLYTACFWDMQQQTAMFHLSSSVTHLPLSSPSMQTHLHTDTNANMFCISAPAGILSTRRNWFSPCFQFSPHAGIDCSSARTPFVLTPFGIRWSSKGCPGIVSFASNLQIIC